MKNAMKFATAALAMGAFSLSGPLSAQATGETVVVGATSAAPGSSGNSLGIALSGFNSGTTYIAIVSTTSGQLSLGTTSGLTALVGYSDITLPSDSFGFEGAYSDIEAALASLTLDAPAAAGDATIDVSVTEAPGGAGTYFYYPANQHYYEYVAVDAGDISWGDAQVAASGKSLLGMTGYLATLTDSNENDFIANKTSAVNAWIGAARSNANIDGSYDALYDTTDAAGLAFEWKTGPEAGTIFFHQTAWDVGGGTTDAGYFSSWESVSDSEPNNYQYSELPGWHEGFAVTNWNGSVGRWNDLPNTPLGSDTVPGYLVEYGGIGTSTASQASVTQSIIVTDEPAGGLPLTGLSAEKLLATAMLGAGFLAMALGSFNGRRRLREFAIDDRLRSTLKRLDASLTRVEKRISRSRRER